MSHSIFMPSWAAVLRDQYLEKSRGQPNPKRTQAYYYEIHRKPAVKSLTKENHDLASCPFAPKQEEHVAEKSQPEAIAKAFPIHLLPVYDAAQPGDVLYKPVALLPDAAVDAHKDLDRPAFPAASKVSTTTQDPNTKTGPNRQHIEKTDHDLQSTVSEYGFFSEEHDIPEYYIRTPRYREIQSYVRDNGTQVTYEAPRILWSPHRITATPARRRYYHQYYEQPEVDEHRRAHHQQHYNPHHVGCICDRPERRANLHRQSQAHFQTPHGPPATSRMAPRYQQENTRNHSPIRYRPCHSPRFSVHFERRPSYNRDRTPSPRRREI